MPGSRAGLAALTLIAACGGSTTTKAPDARTTEPDAFVATSPTDAAPPDGAQPDGALPDAALPDAALPDSTPPADASPADGPPPPPVDLTLDCEHRIGGAGDDHATGVAVAADGSTIIIGSFAQTADFDPVTSLTAIGVRDAFIARYDRACQLVWVKQAGGADATVAATNVALDTTGIWIEAALSGTATFDTQTVASTAPPDVVVARYDLDGGLTWIAQVPGAVPGGVAAGADAACYATSQATQSTIACLDATQAPTWSETLPIDVHAIAVSPIYPTVVAVGAFRGAQTLDDGLGTQIPITSAGGTDAVAVEFRQDGALGWANTAGDDAGDDSFDAVTINGREWVFVGGTVEGGGYVGRYNYDRAWSIGGASTRVRALTLGLDDVLVVAGSFSGVAQLGYTTLTSSGGADAFVASVRLDSGQVLWARGGGGAADDAATGVAIYADDEITTVGDFAGSAEVLPAGGASVASAGGVDGFTFAMHPPPLNAAQTIPPLRCLIVEPGAGPLSVVADTDGSAVVLGSTASGTTLGAGEPGATPLPIGSFVARYDASCRLVWATSITTAAAPGDGLVVLTGTAIVAALNNELVTLDDSGNLVGVRPISTAGGEYRLAAAPDGTFYVAFDYDGDATLDPDGAAPVALPTTTGGGIVGAFAHLAADGSLLWSRVYYTDPSRAIYPVLSASADGVFVSALETAGPALTYGAGEPNETTASILCSDYGCIVFARYAADGTLDWLEEADGFGSYQPAAIATTTTGGLLAAGSQEPYGGAESCLTFGATQLCALGASDSWIASYDATGGSIFATGNGVGDGAGGVADDGAGGAFATGAYGFVLRRDDRFGAIQLHDLGGYDAFVEHIDATGTVDWARSGGSSGAQDSGHAVSTAPDGSVFALGRIGGWSVWDYGWPDITERAQGGMFLAVYGP